MSVAMNFVRTSAMSMADAVDRRHRRLWKVFWFVVIASVIGLSYRQKFFVVRRNVEMRCRYREVSGVPGTPTSVMVT